jgi:hypothetical protein
VDAIENKFKELEKELIPKLENWEIFFNMNNEKMLEAKEFECLLDNSYN